MSLSSSISPIALLGEAKATPKRREFYMRYLGDPVLSTECQRLVDASDIPYGLLDAIKHARTHAWAEGLGVAANQVGASLRLAIAMLLAAGSHKRREVLMINPRIVERSPETVMMLEGCLSIPNFRTTLRRHVWVVVDYHDEGFTRQRLKVEGMDAQIIQHETDHLDGRLITDNVSRQQRRAAMREVQKITGDDR